jgi:hypothetical protein
MAKEILFTVRVFAMGHESHASALAHIDRACQTAAHDARAQGGGKLNGVILGDGATPIGEWSYEPAAAAALEAS